MIRSLTQSKMVRRLFFACAAAWLVGLPLNAGAELLSNPVADGAIVIDADRSDWTDITRYTDDTQEGYPTDLGFVTMAHDSLNLYIRYQMYSPSGAFSGVYRLLLDTDQNLSTGYNGQGSAYANSVGANIYVEGASVFEHTGGTQDAFVFNSLGSATFANTGAGAEDVEMAIPLALLGNPDAIDFVVWLDSNGDFGLSDESAPGGDDSFPNGVYQSLTKASATYVIVPEPASMALLALGGVAVFGRWRRRGA